jgi:hypothetical protein
LGNAGGSALPHKGNDWMTSANPSKELRRLLSVLRDNLRRPGTGELRWQHSYVDNFVEKMLPLWEECGIAEPGFYIIEDTHPAFRIPSDTSFKSIEYRDPDGCVASTIFLESSLKAGGNKVVATMDELSDVADVAEWWIGWLDARTAETRSGTLFVPPDSSSLLTETDAIERQDSRESQSGNCEHLAGTASKLQMQETKSRLAEVTHPATSLPNAETVTPTSNERLNEMRDSWRLAYLAWKYAESRAGKGLTAPEAWAYLKSKPSDSDSYPLPKVGTFADYVTNARRFLGELKNKPRSGRLNGTRSIVRQSDL